MSKASLPQVPAKRSRNAVSGKFDPRGPLNDKRLLVYVIEVIRACDTLTPVMLALSSVEDERQQLLEAAILAMVLVRTSYEHQLYPAESSPSDEINPERLLATLRKNWEPLLKKLPGSLLSVGQVGGKK